MKKNILLSFSLSMLVLFSASVFSATVFAAKWPGDRWTNNDGTNIAIKLEKTDIHTDITATFAAYVDGNVTTSSGTALTLTINKFNDFCNLQNTAKLRIVKPNGSSNDYEACGDVPDTLTPDKSNGQYLAGANVTRFKYTFRIISPVNNVSQYQFNINYDASVVRVGFVGSNTDTLPISMANREKDFWTDLRIPLIAGAPACSASASPLNGLFNFYDFDSWNSLAGAQDNGGGDGDPDGWDGDFPNRKYEWRQLSFAMHTDSNPIATDNMNPISLSNDRPADRIVGWTNISDKTATNNNRFAPNSRTTGEIGSLEYSFKKGRSYTIKINNLNGQNYFSFNSPFDENVGFSCNTNWEITSQSTPSYQTITTGNSATITHYIRNIGPGNTDEAVESKISGDFDTDDTTSLDLSSGTVASISWQKSKTRSKTFNAVGRYNDTLTYTPRSSETTASGTSSAYVDVIDPDGFVDASASYEKGDGGFTVNSYAIVNKGVNCPTSQIAIPYKVTIGGIVKVDTTFNYGGAAGCNNVPTDLIKIDATLRSQLDSMKPGPSGIQYCLSVNNEGDKCGEILVFEVPFARFYGNDIYATNGEIRFNDATNDPVFDNRGSASQYAALSFGTVKIDTSAFRNLLPIPNPPNGLDVAGIGSDLNRINATAVYNKVKNNLPTNCAQIDSGGLQAPVNGCYTLNDGTVGWSSGIPFIGWGDTIGSGVTTYNKKVTISNPTDKMLMIVGDIVNNSSYADPSSAGVLLVVSQGPIVIDNNVRRVDAILVSNSGVYTCGIAGFGPLLKKPQNGIHDTCREPLNINGAISAPTIDFRRAVGSRYLNAPGGGDEQQNCNISKGIQNCDVRGTSLPNNTGATAEIINFPTYLYFAKPFLRDTSVSGGETDAIFVAPPRL